MPKNLFYSAFLLFFSFGLFASDSKGVLHSYSSLHKALAGDKLVDARATATAAQSDLANYLKTVASPTEPLNKMQAGIQALAQSQTDEESRKAFGLYSEGATSLIRQNDSLKKDWQLFYCPMVPKGTFGYWAQPKGESILNPYYGAKMLTCGVKRPW